MWQPTRKSHHVVTTMQLGWGFAGWMVPVVPVVRRAGGARAGAGHWEGWVFENGSNEVASGGGVPRESLSGIPSTWTRGLRPTGGTATSRWRRGGTGWWWRGRARGPTGP